MFAALPLAWKIGAPVGIVLAIIGGYLGWQHYQQSIGRAEAEAEYRAELMAQQQEAIGHYIVSEKLKLRAVERAGAAKDQLSAKLRENFQAIVELDRLQDDHEQNGVRYEPCVVSPLVRGAVNDLSRVLNDLAAQRPASAGGAAGEPAGPRGGAAAGAGGGGDRSGSGEADPRADGPLRELHH